MTPSDPVVIYTAVDELEFQGSVFRYPGRAGQAVRRLKYDRRTGLAPFMAEAIRTSIESEGIEFDLAIPIPIHWFREVSRGFNQADLLAKGLPNRAMGLRRTRATRPQAGLDTSERLKNLDGAFEVIVEVKGKSILLIDDVFTSGQTARECAKVLRNAGAHEIGIFAFCGDIY
jgi:ComF family protein